MTWLGQNVFAMRLASTIFCRTFLLVSLSRRKLQNSGDTFFISRQVLGMQVIFGKPALAPRRSLLVNWLVPQTVGFPFVQWEVPWLGGGHVQPPPT